MLFINPRMAELKNEVPLREHLGTRRRSGCCCPESYITTLAFRKKDRAGGHGRADRKS